MTTAIRDIELLNADYQPLGRVTFQKAVRLLAKEKAVVEIADETKGRLREWLYPKVIRLVKIAKLNYKKLYGTPLVSKSGVLRRDGYKCAYCGDHAKTIDHIMPRSRCKSDPNTWLNMVAACFSCNNKKDNKTPQEAGMKMLFMPFTPTRAQLIAASSK